MDDGEVDYATEVVWEVSLDININFWITIKNVTTMNPSWAGVNENKIWGDTQTIHFRLSND